MEQNTEQQKIAASSEQIQEIDLLELFNFYMSRIPLIIAALVIGAVLAGATTFYLIPDRYTAVARMYMISASSDSVVNLSDLNIGASLSNDYVELMKSRPVIEEVINRLGLAYTYEQVSGMVDLTVVNSTRIVKISVTSTDPQEAMDIANQMAWTSKARLPLVMDAPAPSIAEEAVFPEHTSSPSLSKNILVGALFGVMAVLGVLTILFLLDDTIKTAEDVERELGVIPLAVIPEGVIEGLSDTGDTVRKARNRRKKSKKKGEMA